MKKMLTVDDLARDQRFERIRIEDLLFDPRSSERGQGGSFQPKDPDAPDGARQLMHSIFVGEIQALEGAGRTCYDFDIGSGTAEVPFELKLDMARQCWDEARHCEISIKLGEHMGTYIGEFAEQVLLFEAACNADPVLRLTGVNRALEGLAIDVFNSMRDYGSGTDDPVLYFCEDWMLADEVTHVKMGSDWLRRITANDPERQKAGPRLPAHRRQAVQLRRTPQRRRGQPDPSGAALPQPRRVHRRRDSRTRRRLRRGRRRSQSDGRHEPRHHPRRRQLTTLHW